MRVFATLVILLCHILMSGQTPSPDDIPANNKTGRKGNVYVTWGYNRAYYNRSDVHFKGEGFDFTLEKVRAEDMPEKFDTDVYLNPTQFTVPQFNFRAGFYFRENTAVSLGWDHMKYHIIPTQKMRVNGHIDEDLYPDPSYTGDFHHDEILYTPEFMDYHHSDGFNFVRIALEQRVPFWKSRNGNHLVALNGSFSAGAVMPWTDFTFFGERHLNKLHLAGYGFSAGMGVRYEFFRWFFLQVNAQAGWTNLVNIMLEDELPSRAEQKITFFERSWSLGGYIPLKRGKKAQ